MTDAPAMLPGLIRAEDAPLGYNRTVDGFIRKFHFPHVTSYKLLFKPVAKWDIIRGARDIPHTHPASVIRRNCALPRVSTRAVCYCHWDRGPNNWPAHGCFAIEPVCLSEQECAEQGIRWASYLAEAGRRGCDEGYGECVSLIDWRDNRTLVLVKHRIADAWVTLIDTAELEAALISPDVEDITKYSKER